MINVNRCIKNILNSPHVDDAYSYLIRAIVINIHKELIRDIDGMSIADIEEDKQHEQLLGLGRK